MVHFAINFFIISNTVRIPKQWRYTLLNAAQCIHLIDNHVAARLALVTLHIVEQAYHHSHSLNVTEPVRSTRPVVNIIWFCTVSKPRPVIGWVFCAATSLEFIWFFPNYCMSEVSPLAAVLVDCASECQVKCSASHYF